MVAFLAPSLRRLEDCPAELAVFFCFEELRPFQGILSRVDWRLHGRLSKKMIEGFFGGERLAPLLVLPGKLLPVPYILLMGLGDRHTFDKGDFTEAVTRAFEVQSALKVRRAAMALPGRIENQIEAENAMEWFIEAYDRCAADIEEVFLLELPAHQKAMTPALERWRLRRLIPGFTPA